MSQKSTAGRVDAVAEPEVPSASPLTAKTLKEVLDLVAHKSMAPRERLERSLRHLARWRQKILLNTYRQKHGSVVFGGPFEGMTYHNASEGATLPRLLGCYEAELHPIIESLPQKAYTTIVDIGCAEGYYAIGLARLLPDVQVLAHDISSSAQRACQAAAQENGVSHRVAVGGEFSGDQFASLPARTLVVCDIEGAERELLDPQRYAGLSQVDLLVEVHECFHSGLVQTLQDRFASTHDIQWETQSVAANRQLPSWVDSLAHLDQILCTWEWRMGPTPWAHMTQKSRSNP